jgi:hypothetical protein
MWFRRAIYRPDLAPRLHKICYDFAGDRSGSHSREMPRVTGRPARCFELKIASSNQQIIPGMGI